MIDLFDELRRVVKTLSQAQVPYVIVGGLAYSIWVESRNTEDIDLLILSEDWPNVATLLEPLGYWPLAEPMDFRNVRIRRLTKLQDNDSLVLDLVLADEHFRACVDNPVKLEYDDQEYCLAPPEVLIEMKSARMSSKDIQDIEGLQKLLKGKRE